MKFSNRECVKGDKGELFQVSPSQKDDSKSFVYQQRKEMLPKTKKQKTLVDFSRKKTNWNADPRKPLTIDNWPKLKTKRSKQHFKTEAQ